jgi:predicted transcriptional regulator
MRDDTIAPEKHEASGLVALTANIVSAYVTKNPVASTEISSLIQQVHDALERVSGGGSEPSKEDLKPVVPIKKSVTPDYIICLDDGKQFKSLKRHLRTAYNMSPEEYRAKWGLPYDYPMVAPNYAQTRSMLAKKMGLGRQSVKSQARGARR